MVRVSLETIPSFSQGFVKGTAVLVLTCVFSSIIAFIVYVILKKVPFSKILFSACFCIALISLMDASAK